MSRKSHAEPGASKGDADLVRKVLAAATLLKTKQLAQELRISERTVARWKKGDIRQLQPTVRERLKRFVLAGVDADGRSAALMVVWELRAKLDEIEARIGQVSIIDLPASMVQPEPDLSRPAGAGASGQPPDGQPP